MIGSARVIVSAQIKPNAPEIVSAPMMISAPVIVKAPVIVSAQIKPNAPEIVSTPLDSQCPCNRQYPWHHQNVIFYKQQWRDLNFSNIIHLRIQCLRKWIIPDYNCLVILTFLCSIAIGTQLAEKKQLKTCSSGLANVLNTCFKTSFGGILVFYTYYSSSWPFQTTGSKRI